MNGIIQEMLTLLKGEAHRYPIAMRAELTTELPKIMVDRVQLQQVFMNLMLNALEAMKDSGGELTVKSQLQDDQLQFSVSDAGVGLPMEKIGHQPFHCGVAWRAVVGKRQQWRGRNFSFHPTDPGHGVIALGCLDFWSWAYSALACR